MLQSLAKGGNDQQRAVITTIADLNADVLLLTGIDYDAGGQTLAALAGALAGAVLALAAGWWGLREVLLRPVVDTLRRAAE